MLIKIVALNTNTKEIVTLHEQYGQIIQKSLFKCKY